MSKSAARAALSLFTLIVAGSLCAALRAGEKKGPPEPPPPAPEHKLLKDLVGTFNADVTIYVGSDQKMESKGTMTRQLILDGRFLQESYDGTFAGKPFKGMGLTGYDTNKKKYVGVWVDSVSNAMMTSEGTYDAKTKTYHFSGDDLDPFSGKPMKARDVLKVVSADEQVMEMYRQPAGEKEFKMMEIRYTRKK
jgi:hypothetical protein